MYEYNDLTPERQKDSPNEQRSVSDSDSDMEGQITETPIDMSLTNRRRIKEEEKQREEWLKAKDTAYRCGRYGKCE